MRIGLAGAPVQRRRGRQTLVFVPLGRLTIERLAVFHLLGQFCGHLLDQLRHVQRENAVFQTAAREPVLFDGLAAKVRPDRSRFRVAIYIVLVFQ